MNETLARRRKRTGDRFGAMPAEAENLVEVIRLKIHAPTPQGGPEKLFLTTRRLLANLGAA